MTDTSDHIRRLADLFLTTPSTAAPAGAPKPAAPPRPTVEGLIVGNLPVRAGLWLTQYADDVARSAGPTALLRLDSATPLLEIIRAPQAAALVSGIPMLRDAVRHATALIGHWIIRPSSAREHRTLLEAGVDRFTVLAGADDAAVVGAYQSIKELMETASEGDLPIPRVEVAILGADSEAARAAAAKLDETARTHLGIEIPLCRTVRAMGALGSTLHLRFEEEEDVSIDDVIDAIRGGRPVEETLKGDAPPEPAAEEPKPSPTDWARRVATPLGVDPEEPIAARSPEQVGMPQGGPARLRPKPAAAHVEPKGVVPPKSAKPMFPVRALSTWIEGLAALPVRCPDADDVEIAIDTIGGMHLVTWEDRLRRVFVAEAWLAKHRDLLSMACPDHTFATDRPITRHIITSEPLKVADLHGTSFRLHVLAPVEVEGKTGWYAAALNG